MRRVCVDADSPSLEILEEVARAVRGGGIVAVPTDTLYGLAVDPFRPEAVARLLAAKGRPPERALPLIAATTDQVSRCFGPLSSVAQRLADRFWPGPLTLLLPAPGDLPAGVSAGTGRVGVRVPAHAVARGLCRACGHLLTATSANLSGQPPASDPEEVARTLGDRIDVLLDAGHTQGGAPSTIVDVTSAAPRLVRDGAVEWHEVEACARLG